MSQFDFPLNRAIYSFNNEEPFTIGNACEGVQIFGGIGSGKTSGSGEAIARAFLNAGFGGLVLCAKKDVLDDWKRYAHATGRSEQLLVFDVSGDFVFPFLQYEIEREGEGAGSKHQKVKKLISRKKRWLPQPLHPSNTRHSLRSLTNGRKSGNQTIRCDQQANRHLLPQARR